MTPNLNDATREKTDYEIEEVTVQVVDCQWCGQEVPKDDIRTVSVDPALKAGPSIKSILDHSFIKRELRSASFNDGRMRADEYFGDEFKPSMAVGVGDELKVPAETMFERRKRAGERQDGLVRISTVKKAMEDFLKNYEPSITDDGGFFCCPDCTESILDLTERRNSNDA